MKTQKIARKRSTIAVAGDHGLPVDRFRRCLLEGIAVAPLLLGMPAEAGEWGGTSGVVWEAAGVTRI